MMTPDASIGRRPFGAMCIYIAADILVVAPIEPSPYPYGKTGGDDWFHHLDAHMRITPCTKYCIDSWRDMGALWGDTPQSQRPRL